METWIVILILAVIAAAIVGYLVHSKRKGAACVGCPYAKQCSGRCSSSAEYFRMDKKK